jgi:hypothetical protein
VNGNSTMGYTVTLNIPTGAQSVELRQGPACLKSGPVICTLWNGGPGDPKTFEVWAGHSKKFALLGINYQFLCRIYAEYTDLRVVISML